ncbi:glycerol-3-phosphate-1-acyltransferase [Trametes maxima]|nr:glycerol-3-phosphate-1-acyltransferase [Trametes maxima]
MEAKLVYRGLRQLSDWALRFYSEIPVTIPHGRPVCFWAKSTMFKNPLVRTILLSSGSIPVARNPNSVSAPAEPGQGQSTVHEALFRETFKALDREEVIGVFPEGTSYTEPGIAQVKDGASRAALEYVKWAQETKDGGQGRKLQIVPVGIVYTNKSQYQSKPIDVEAFANKRISEDQTSSLTVDSRSLVKELSAEIEKEMMKLTINAPDWDTLYAIEAARDILWDGRERLPASHFVWISQNLVSLFSDPHAAPSASKARQALLRYHSLLYYADISHGALWGILPDPSTRPSRSHAIGIFIRQLLIAVLHPRFVFFLSTLPAHIPAYATGLLADRILGNPEEEETHAQFKAIAGGVAASAAYAGVTALIVRKLVGGSAGMVVGGKTPAFILPALKSLCAAGRWLFNGDSGLSGRARAAVGVFGIFYATSFLVSRWHNYWVGSNYTQFKRLIASWKLVIGLLSPRSGELKGERLTPYTVPYIPPPNPFIKRLEGAQGVNTRAHLPRAPLVSSRKLIRPLLEARSEATRSLWSFLVDSKYLRGLVSAKMKGEAWMQVGPATPPAL